MKFYAGWCRSCKALAPKFLKATQEVYSKDIVFAQMDVAKNKDFVRTIGIIALPSVHFYGNEMILENFPCGPTKVPILRVKLKHAAKNLINSETGRLLPRLEEPPEGQLALPIQYMEAVPCKERALVAGGEEKSFALTKAMFEMIKSNVYFKDVPDADFTAMMAKATLRSYEPNSVVMRQGGDGNNFYVIASGEVEVRSRTGYEDPLTTPDAYLGSAIRRLSVSDHFGERSLITGQKRAASIITTNTGDSKTTRLFTFKKEDIPTSCLLSKAQGGEDQDRKLELRQLVDEKYGKVEIVDFGKAVQIESQKRGSVNRPQFIDGVDGEYSEEEDIQINESILPLLVKYRQVLLVSKCFEYILNRRTTPKWGDASELTRRNILVNQLSESQKTEFREVFAAVDISNDGSISILELKRFLESIGENHSEDELKDMIDRSNPMVSGNETLEIDEFLGMMAEAEFYYLFLEIFSVLDDEESGFIRAGDLRKKLGGIESLMSDERTLILGQGSDDDLINYEAFSRMLLGA